MRRKKAFGRYIIKDSSIGRPNLQREAVPFIYRYASQIAAFSSKSKCLTNEMRYWSTLVGLKACCMYMSFSSGQQRMYQFGF